MYLASSPQVEGVNGAYFANNKLRRFLQTVIRHRRCRATVDGKRQARRPGSHVIPAVAGL